MSKENKLIVIVGPTASGKSGLAIKLAKKFGGEIISADSRQIYKGLKIGSGAATKKEMGNIPHHLINIVDPKKTFTVAEYKKLAQREMSRIWKKNKLPIFVGGTGLYIRAAVDGLVIPKVKPNLKLRKTLERKSIMELSEILKKTDIRRWREIDRQNPRRLIRAIEIAATLGKIPKLKLKPLAAKVLFLGVKRDKEVLESAVRKRVKKMIRDGLITETEKLRRADVSDKKIREFGFEYANTLDFIENKIGSKSELIRNIVKATLKYAKRQMTWFRRDERIFWVKNKKEAIQKSKEFLDSSTKFQAPSTK